jgi:redox-sensitive bicupin YhaK (pirin superfamily)
MSRKIFRKYTPSPQPGFLGRGHSARAVVQGDYAETDPFIFLMDDLLDKKDEEPAGGPHPHAGFETVTLMLEGELGVGSHTMKAGDLQMMTAGKGIIHTETIEQPTRMRLLQLWLVLPRRFRWTEPRVQDLKAANVPVATQPGVQIRIYSGNIDGIASPLKNYVPVIIAEVKMDKEARASLDIPFSNTTFLYVLEGEIIVGDDKLSKHDVGWLERSEQENGPLTINAGALSGARFVLYSGEPQGDAIVSNGPFIADSQEEIRQLYHEYNKGSMQHISSVPEEQVFQW